MVWQFRGSPERPFYSETCGTTQRLPNGNALITESDYGRALEVTSEGEVVWEFNNPERAGDRNEYVAAVFELTRVPPDFPIHWASAPERTLSADSLSSPRDCADSVG